MKMSNCFTTLNRQMLSRCGSDIPLFKYLKLYLVYGTFWIWLTL